jgi:hypothetical protein
MQFARGGANAVLTASGSDCAVTPKTAPGAEDLAAWTRLYCLFQPAGLVRRFLDARVKPQLEGPLPSAGAEWIVRAGLGEQAYELVLQGNLLPARASSKVAGAGLVDAQYERYETMPGSAAAFPAHLIFRLHDAKRTEAEFVFDTTPSK